MESRLKTLAAVCLLWSLGALSCAVHAAPVTWRATGRLILGPYSGVIPSTAKTGDTFTMDVTYEPAPCGSPCPDIGYRYYMGAVLSMTIRLPDWSLTVPLGGPRHAFFYVEQDQPTSPAGYIIDRYIFQGQSTEFPPELPPTAPTQYFAQISLDSLGEPPGVAPITPIKDLSLPLSPPDFRAFDQARLAFFADEPSTQLSDRAIGDITSLCLLNSEGRCSDEVENLLDALRDATVGVGPGKSLTKKIELAETYLSVGDVQAACAVLTGFVHEVDAQRGKKLAPDFASKLVADAQGVMTAIGCN